MKTFSQLGKEWKAICDTDPSLYKGAGGEAFSTVAITKRKNMLFKEWSYWNCCKQEYRKTC